MKQAEVEALLAIKGFTLQIGTSVFRTSNKDGWKLRKHYDCVVSDKDGDIVLITKYYLQRRSVINKVAREYFK